MTKDSDIEGAAKAADQKPQAATQTELPAGVTYKDPEQGIAGGVNAVLADDKSHKITTGSGPDDIKTGSGNNVINAGAGNNTIQTGSGDDQIKTLAGDDFIRAGDGNNIVDAGNGNNRVNGGNGDDTIQTGSGNDFITGAAGNDRIVSGAGDDTIYPGIGQNYVDAGAGDDEIHLETGSAFVYAGDGNDSVTIPSGAADIHIHGGPGDDKYYISTQAQDIQRTVNINDFSAGDTLTVKAASTGPLEFKIGESGRLTAIFKEALNTNKAEVDLGYVKEEDLVIDRTSTPGITTLSVKP